MFSPPGHWREQRGHHVPPYSAERLPFDHRQFLATLSALILTEAVLSYLGVGIANEPSWGAIINDAKQRLWLGNWWELAGATAAMFFSCWP